MMKFHQITGGMPRVESVVTLPEAIVSAVRSQPVIDRFYDGYTWYHSPGSYAISRANPILITFSDGTLGSCEASQLGPGLAEFDVTIAEPETDGGALAA